MTLHSENLRKRRARRAATFSRQKAVTAAAKENRVNSTHRVLRVVVPRKQHHFPRFPPEQFDLGVVLLQGRIHPSCTCHASRNVGPFRRRSSSAACALVDRTQQLLCAQCWLTTPNSSFGAPRPTLTLRPGPSERYSDAVGSSRGGEDGGAKFEKLRRRSWAGEGVARTGGRGGKREKFQRIPSFKNMHNASPFIYRVLHKAF